MNPALPCLRRIHGLFWFSWLIGLAGCASPPTPRLAATASWNIPLPQHVLVTQTRTPSASAAIAPSWWVVVQDDGQKLRWSRFDHLGVPDARQWLSPQGLWQPEGFLPPNPQARELFAALLFAWMPPELLDVAYGENQWQIQDTPDGGRTRIYQEHARTRWTVRWPDAARHAVFSIHTQDGTVWQVCPLPAG